MKNIKRNILLNPGPSTTTDTVKMAQVVPDICPREDEFAEMMRQMRKRPCEDRTRRSSSILRFCFVVPAH